MLCRFWSRPIGCCDLSGTIYFDCSGHILGADRGFLDSVLSKQKEDFYANRYCEKSKIFRRYPTAFFQNQKG